jgi:3'(2'), 5'-bisphosphate nucleotidase
MPIELARVVDLARLAGERILEVYRQEFSVEEKEDRSPLTEADRRSHETILAGLRDLAPDIPCVSEEGRAIPFETRRSWNRCWMVDPLDGTKEFIKKNGEFTVNIALVEAGIPVLGVVCQPVTGTVYAATRGAGATRTSADGSVLRLTPGPHYRSLDRVRVVASRSHLTPETADFIAALEAEGKAVDLTSAGSSLKLCLVAEGSADVYPRFGPTMEWDTAAAHAVALEAGRTVLAHPSGEPLRYNKESLLNPWFLVA